MKILLLIPLLFLASCVSKLDVADESGALIPAGRFDRFANNGRDAENMSHSFALLEQIQQEGAKGQVIFWETGGREYFHAMRQLGPSVHQGPNPSLGYYTSRREVVNVDANSIPWARVLNIIHKNS